MKILIFILSINLLISCSQKSISTETSIREENNSVNKVEKIKEEKPLEKLNNSAKQIKMANVKDFGIFKLKRNSNNKDESGWKLPPFESAEVEISLNHEPKTGEKITIIPLKVNLEPFQLSVTKATKIKNEVCDVEGFEREFFWNTELEKITNKEILEIKPVKYDNQELPFEVFGIYPAVEFVRNLSPKELKQEMLPKGVSVQTIEAAIDLDNDGKPDLLEVIFCCSDKHKSPSEDGDCYICQKSFKKINGVWKLVDAANPC